MGNIRYALNSSTALEKGPRLLYVTASSYGRDWASIKHTHYFCELFFIKDGRGSFEMGETSFSVIKNDLVIVNPNISHTEVSVPEKPLEYVVLGIEGVKFDFGNGRDEYFLCNLSNQKDEFYTFLDVLLHENEQKAQGYEEISQALLKVFLIKLQRLSTKMEETSDEQRENKECDRIKRYIAANYASDITLDKLSEMAHLSKYYLIHSFTKSYGMSPINYLNEVRIRTSKELLESTDYTVGQIAQSTGFASQSYFSQSFRKACGQTPAEYRKQALKNKKEQNK